MAVGDELSEDGAKRASTRGSACSTKQTTAEILGMARRRVDGSGCELHDGAGAAASAMAKRGRERGKGEVRCR